MKLMNCVLLVLVLVTLIVSCQGDVAGTADDLDYTAIQSEGSLLGERSGFLVLDGIDDYVEIPENVITTATFTLEAKVLLMDVGGGLHNQNTIFQQRGDLSGQDNVSTVVLHADNNDRLIAIQVRSSDGSVENVTTDTHYPKWHHYAAVIGSDSMYLYLDGRLMGSTLLNQEGDYITDIDYVDIGRHTHDGIDRGFLAGAIDELRVWDHPRPVHKIQATMRDELSPEYYETADSGLVAYYRFNKPWDFGVNNDGKDDIRDWSVKENHGDLVGNSARLAQW